MRFKRLWDAPFSWISLVQGAVFCQNLQTIKKSNSIMSGCIGHAKAQGLFPARQILTQRASNRPTSLGAAVRCSYHRLKGSQILQSLTCRRNPFCARTRAWAMDTATYDAVGFFDGLEILAGHHQCLLNATVETIFQCWNSIYAHPSTSFATQGGVVKGTVKPHRIYLPS